MTFLCHDLLRDILILKLFIYHYVLYFLNKCLYLSILITDIIVFGFQSHKEHRPSPVQHSPNYGFLLLVTFCNFFNYIHSNFCLSYD